VALPRAVRYGGVRVSTYGARSVAGYADKGVVLYEDESGDITSHGGVLGAKEGWHQAEKVAGKTFLHGRTLHWWAGTTNANFYDVRAFRVSYTYDVLR
jgi:hypothetical protein